MKAGLSTKNAPSPNVVLPHYAFGAIAFLVASVLLFFTAGDIINSYLGGRILGVAHILILGWITMIIFGALYQLIPVVMEVRLFSEILAHISLYSLILGTIFLYWSFWDSYISTDLSMEIGGTAIFISVILFVVNALMSAQKTKQKTIENTFIITSAFWLLFTVSLGILIVLNVFYKFIDKNNLELLKIHVNSGIIGWFMMLVIGVGSKLLPMFFIAHKLNRNYLRISYILTNFGHLALAVSLYFFPNKYLLTVIALTIISGILFFVKYNYDAYKMRLRKKLDVGMKLTVVAFLFLFLTIISGFLSIIKPDFLEKIHISINIIYGISLILGFLTSLILGQMYKTLPFIIWLKKYGNKVGKFKVPMPADLYSKKVANLHYYSFVVAIVLILIGIITKIEMVVQISAVAFVITASLYGYNTFKIIFHKEKLEKNDE